MRRIERLDRLAAAAAQMIENPLDDRRLLDARDQEALLGRGSVALRHVSRSGD